MRKRCIDMVYELAKKDPRVVFIGSDLSPGLLSDMQREFPDRYFMEGISEANVIGMAAGLALRGYIPYVNTIATFNTRRCYEQVAVDACMHKLPIRLISNGGGLVYAPLGPTHLAIEDIAIMRALPNMTVFAASDAEEMERMMRTTLDVPQPIYIRLAKGGDKVVSKPELGFTFGKAILLKDATAGAKKPVLIISTGIGTTQSLVAAELLESQGIATRVLHLHTIKPLDVEAVLHYANEASFVTTVEEHILAGGLGSLIAETFADNDVRHAPLMRLGIDDVFAKHYGGQDDLMRTYGLMGDQIAARIKTRVEGNTSCQLNAAA